MQMYTCNRNRDMEIYTCKEIEIEKKRKDGKKIFKPLAVSISFVKISAPSTSVKVKP